MPERDAVRTVSGPVAPHSGPIDRTLYVVSFLVLSSFVGLALIRATFEIVGRWLGR